MSEAAAVLTFLLPFWVKPKRKRRKKGLKLYFVARVTNPRQHATNGARIADLRQHAI